MTPRRHAGVGGLPQSARCDGEDTRAGTLPPRSPARGAPIVSPIKVQIRLGPTVDLHPASLFKRRTWGLRPVAARVERSDGQGREGPVESPDFLADLRQPGHARVREYQCAGRVLPVQAEPSLRPARHRTSAPRQQDEPPHRRGGQYESEDSQLHSWSVPRNPCMTMTYAGWLIELDMASLSRIERSSARSTRRTFECISRSATSKASIAVAARSASGVGPDARRVVR